MCWLVQGTGIINILSEPFIHIYRVKMAEQDRSMSGSKQWKNSSISGGLSGVLSKSVVQGHIKSIMPSLRGGKKQDEIKYLHVRVQDNLEHEKDLQGKLKKVLNQLCEDYYDYKVFQTTDEILNEEINEQDLYYIFLKEELASWGEKFAKQELKESDGKKSINIVQFLKAHKYAQKRQQREKLIQKNRRDPNQKMVYFINSNNPSFQDELRETVFKDMEVKLAGKLRRQGDRVKTWALANKFKHRKTKRQRLYIYIQESIRPKVQSLYQRFRSRSSFKWTQIIPFTSFEDLLKHLKKRQDQLAEQASLVGSIAVNPVSKIFDRTQSAIKSVSVIGGSTIFGGPQKSVKEIINDKMEPNLREVDKNFIIHSYDFEEKDKIYQFVMGQKGNNWQRVIYEDKNYPEMDRLVKQIKQNEQQRQNDQYIKMLNARTLNIMTYTDDTETERIYNSTQNTLGNRYLIGYYDINSLKSLLNQYARNDDDFTIVIVRDVGSDQEVQARNFIVKNQLCDDNIVVLAKRGNQMNQTFLSMNSKLSINDQKDVDKFLLAVMEDRDRNFDPTQMYADNYVYILYRDDKQYLIDDQMRKKIGESARLKKAPYRDRNYLEGFLKSIERSGDYSIILTEDDGLREAQEVAKKFDKASVMNITDRKGVKTEIKVIAWGPYESIKKAIFDIKDKQKVTKRKEYKKVGNEIARQNSIPRRMPKVIPFREGNNITVKLSSLETNPQSQAMEQNLNQYFKQEIRIENYNNPNQIRLVNKVEEPLTFIICRDNSQELNYMKSIAKQEKDDLRQQYILYTGNPNAHNDLFNDPKYERFRFISNSWAKIQEYIIGSYRTLRGINKEDNDTIYDDQIIHVFYHRQDEHLYRLWKQNYVNSKIYPQVQFHTLQDLQMSALEQSPHHLYYILVDQNNGKVTSAQVGDQIQRIEKILERRGVAPKNMKMLIINKKAGPRNKYVQGTFQQENFALDYIAKTNVAKSNIQILKPHILIDKGSNDWYYFLNKNQDRGKYHFHFIDSNEQALKIIENIRTTEVGSQFWYLTSHQKDMTKFIEAANNIQSGRNIYGVYHGNSPFPAGSLHNKIIFADPNREQIEAFILNAHKRSQRVFSPESLRNRKPILAMSKVNRQKIPIDPIEIKKWKADLGADEFYFDNIADLRNLPADRNVFLITDPVEDKNLLRVQENWPNLWRIIFDTNERSRRKAHSLISIYPKQRETYYGFYPAEIKHYLRNLRYNIKNPPQKLRNAFPSEVTNVYMQKDLNLTTGQLEKLLKNNASISNVWTFINEPNDMRNAVNHALSFPNYNNLFIFTSESEKILNQTPNGNRMNYIVYDPNYRNTNTRIETNSNLLTDQSDEYITYLFNLPQNRYLKALNYKNNAPLKIMYLNNGRFDQELIWLKEISKRNPNFVLVPYQSISDLSQLKENVVVLSDSKGYNDHIAQLRNRENIRYFILGNDKNRNLIANESNFEYFVTKDETELYGFMNNLRRTAGSPILKAPVPNDPFIVKNYQNLKFSRPIAFRSNMDLNALKLLPPFVEKKIRVIPIQPIPVPPMNFNEINLVDASRQQIFHLPPYFSSDTPMNPLNLRQIQSKVRPQIKPQPPVPPKPIIIARPLALKLDYPPSIMQDKFNSRPDKIESIPPQFAKPPPKTIQRKLAIIYFDNKQFKEIVRVLQQNLYPKTFSGIELFPYASEYDLESLARNQNKFMGFDRTIVFLTNKMYRYLDQLKATQNRMKGKLQVYLFNDNFHEKYDSFKQFLHPYTIRDQQIPYINREDSRYWLRTNNYNVMVPLRSMKKYKGMSGPNVSVIPYSKDDDIENQLHQNEQFVIIVCEKKDYNRLKKFPRRSPRCLIVIEESTQPLKEDQVPLMRYPKKVLYYGPDAFNYLSKIRIPGKIGPFASEPMKVLFFNEENYNEQIYASAQEFDEYEKVPYQRGEDLFIKLIQKFKTSSNFKVPQSLVARDLIKLHPKIYIPRNGNMDKYSKQLRATQDKDIIRSFSSFIKPQQYEHLPVQYYDSKELKQILDREQSPCLVFLERSNPQSQALIKDYKRKHLLLMMNSLEDIWIDQKGYLIPAERLRRPQLATKQDLFTQMFNNDVFSSYNDMGYFYLSNSFKEVQRQVRNIKFMTRQDLVKEYNKYPNLLMVIFVQSCDRKFIPSQFYDPIRDESKQPRVKLIFIDIPYVHNENILYIKYDEIDPVILHINRVQLASRNDYCLSPDSTAGRVKWHKFVESHKGYELREYMDINSIEGIAEQIKGKFRKVCVICQPEEEDYIKRKLAEYSIKTKPKTGEQLFFWYFSAADNRSFVRPAVSNLKSAINNLNENSEENDQRFQTAGHQVDIKANSVNNAHYGSNVQPNSKLMSLDQVVESKNFIINLSQNLKDTFSVGNLYTKGVQHFQNLKEINLNSPLNQLIITNENLHEVKNWIQNNSKLFLIYVSNQVPPATDRNSTIIREEEVQRFINRLEGIQRVGAKGQSLGSNSLNVPSTVKTSLTNVGSSRTGHENIHSPSNLQNFKVVKLFYDDALDPQVKRQILFAALKNKNFRPFKFTDMQTLKKLVKEQGSLSLLLVSKDPANLKEELQKQNFTIIKNKKGRKVIVPKHFNSGIDGLSTILQEDESQFQNLSKESHTVDIYLGMLEKNPQKSRRNLISLEKTENKLQKVGSANQLQDLPLNEVEQQDLQKLNVHSNIEGNTEKGNREWIRQRLDGGLLVMFAHDRLAPMLEYLIKKHPLLLQGFQHSINLSQSIREKKDRFTIVLIEPNMLDEIKAIKEQHPKTVFVLLNENNREISAQDRANIAYEIHRLQQIDPIMAQIFEQNQKIKYSLHGKIQSKMDTKKTSYVDNGNSYRFSTSYQNSRVKNAFVFYKDDKNKNLIKKVQYLNHITFVPYKDLSDAQKKFNSYTGHPSVLIANGEQIPEFEDYILKKKDQTYIIKLNPPDDYRENPKIRKNLLLSAHNDDEVASFLVEKFGQHAVVDRSQEKPKEGKNYAPRYQPNGFGTTPRFVDSKDYVPYKNDPIYSTRGLKTISRDSKMQRDAGSARELTPKNSPYQ